MRNGAFFAALFAIVALAAWIRIPGLDERPMHADEAVNAVLTRDLWYGDGYRFDPSGFHGPTLHFATLPSLWLAAPDDFAATTETMYRAVPLVFGLLSIFVLALLADGVGRRGVLAAALLFALSPALAFYHGAYIHETLLGFATLLLIGAGWRWLRSRHTAWAVTAGIAAALMLATKETAVIAFALLSGALVVERLWSGSARDGGGGWRLPPGSGRPVAVGFAVAAGVTLLLYSSFGTHWSGIGDSVRALFGQLELATARGPHRHPFHFYLERLAYFHPRPGPTFSEGLILGLAAVGIIATFRRRTAEGLGTLQRFLVLFSVGMTLVYSAIPYKTPWCLMQFHQPLILVAGVGAATVVRAARKGWQRIAVGVLLALLAAQLGWQAQRATGDYAADSRNPYVYAHSAGDVIKLQRFLERLADAATSQDWSIEILADHPWPLPWVLRRHAGVGYWESIPDSLTAAVVVVGPTMLEEVAERCAGSYEGPYRYGLRPGSVLAVFVRRDVWEDFKARQ